jgi:hypothetical protein
MGFAIVQPSYGNRDQIISGYFDEKKDASIELKRFQDSGICL